MVNWKSKYLEMKFKYINASIKLKGGSPDKFDHELKAHEEAHKRELREQVVDAKHAENVGTLEEVQEANYKDILSKTKKLLLKKDEDINFIQTMMSSLESDYAIQDLNDMLSVLNENVDEKDTKNKAAKSEMLNEVKKELGYDDKKFSVNLENAQEIILESINKIPETEIKKKEIKH